MAARGIFEPLEPRRLLSTTVGFENLAVGPVGNPTTGVYDDPSGFRFTLRSAGGGSPGKPSQIYGAPQGFPSKVLHAAEWGQQYLITRTDGQSFDLASFDRAASRYGDAGDFVITGTFEGGGTQQQTVAFSGSKTPQTLALDWTNLTQVRIAFAGGVNSAYGALDNFVFDDADPPADVVVDYEEAAVGQIASGIYTEDGFTFSNRPGGGGTSLQPLIVHGPQQGFASKVLSTTNWGRRIDIAKDGGGTFDLASFDYAAGRWGEAGDFTLTGHFAAGGTDTRSASFSSKQLATLDLGWTGLELVTINFSGGVNSAYGAVDNFVFGSDGQEDQPPTTTGSLNDPDPVAGPVRINFDGRTWNEAYALLPLPDGSFYVVGQGGDEPAEPAGDHAPVSRVEPTATAAYVTKHFADGSIDSSFGEQGRIELPAGLSHLVDPGPAVGPASEWVKPISGGLVVWTPDGFIKFDENLQPVSTFGTEGIVDASGDFTPLPGGGFAVLEGQFVRVFDASGAEIDSANIHDAILPHLYDGDELLYRRIAEIAADGAGNIFVGVSNNAKPYAGDPTGGPFVGVARFTPGLALDPSYGTDGFARFSASDTEREIHNGLFVGEDGRALIGIDESDGHRDVVYFSADGLEHTWRRYGVDAEMFAASFLDDGTVAFAARTVHQEGGSIVLDGDVRHPFAFYHVDDPVFWSDEDIISFDDFYMPQHLRDVFVAADGSFVAAGFLEDVALNASSFPTDIDHHAALWRVAFPLDKQTTVDFEEATLGQIASGAYAEDGFSFRNHPGSGGTSLQPLIVHGPAQGYASKVLSTTNWGRRIDVARATGGTFGIASFDYGAGRWGEAGDFVLTGVLAGGGTQTRTVSFSSKTLSTLDLDWENLTSLSINFSGGVNSAYGAVDKFVFTV